MKTLSTQNKERILKAAKEKRQATYRSKPIRITTDVTTQTLCRKVMERHNSGPERKQLFT
jgi:hypothetical protein